MPLRLKLLWIESTFFIVTLVQNDFKATEIHNLQTTPLGEFKSLRRVNEITKEVRDGERETCKRKNGSGRRISNSTEENIQHFVRELIYADPHVSVQYISTYLEIPTTTVHRIILT